MKSLKILVTFLVSPSLIVGSGLKLGMCLQESYDRLVSPSLIVGSGLKHLIGVFKMALKSVSPSLIVGSGLKLIPLPCEQAHKMYLPA